MVTLGVLTEQGIEQIPKESPSSREAEKQAGQPEPEDKGLLEILAPETASYTKL